MQTDDEHEYVCVCVLTELFVGVLLLVVVVVVNYTWLLMLQAPVDEIDSGHQAPLYTVQDPPAKSDIGAV